MAKITTQQLMLLPANDERDNAQFLDMLRNDGDFKLFCGMELSEKSLSFFDGYLEANNFFAIYNKDDSDNLLGYVGLSPQHGRIEIEFYIKRDKRCKGYAYEAVTAICSKALNGELEESYSEIYATTSEHNIATQKLLKKCGFEDYYSDIALLGVICFDPDTESVNVLKTVEFVLKKNTTETI